MAIGRKHLFEFNDWAITPQFLRQSITEILGKTVSRGAIYAPALPLFNAFCVQTRCHSVLDLCSGSGQASALFIASLEGKQAAGIQFHLSDLNPFNPATSSQLPANVSKIERPVDACKVDGTPPHQARMMIAAFHHFKPQQAKHILLDAVKANTSVFIVEPFPRRLRSTLPFFVHSFIPGAMNPISSNSHRGLKALFTYLLPVIPLLGWWDTIISALRMYTEQEYLTMVAEATDYHWQYQQLANPLGGAITVFTGIPKALTTAASPGTAQIS